MNFVYVLLALYIDTYNYTICLMKNMIYLFTRLGIILLLTPFITVADNDADVDDIIIQFFHNCKCVPFSECPQINENDPSKQLFECSDSHYICCPFSSINKTPKNTTVENLTVITVNDRISCGQPRTILHGRIFSSESTVAGEVPWMVAIFQRCRNCLYYYKCGGSLIHPKVVLTTTHCVRSTPPWSLKVIASGKEAFQKVGENPENERDVLRIIRHPEYYSGGLYNDIALIMLQEPFDYSKYAINSICLPKNKRVDGERCTAAGWGDTATFLKKIDLPIVNFQHCQDLLRSTRLGPNFHLHSSFLCAGGEEGVDTCTGDGGGALYCLEKNYRYVQIGIVSWGVSCGVINEPGAYTDVAKFKDWIDAELAKYEIHLEQ